METKKTWLLPIVGGGEGRDQPMHEPAGGYVRFLLSVAAAEQGKMHASAEKMYLALDYQKELAERVLSVMELRRPYLKTSFSLDDLAELMEVPKYHLYHCFKHILKTSFVSLRTGYRVAHAKRRLLEADLGATTLEAIGRECGFGTRSNFYRVFQQVTGCTPGVFVERNCMVMRVVREQATCV